VLKSSTQEGASKLDHSGLGVAEIKPRFLRSGRDDTFVCGRAVATEGRKRREKKKKLNRGGGIAWASRGAAVLRPYMDRAERGGAMFEFRQL
jgi:hypothetical protein